MMNGKVLYGRNTGIPGKAGTRCVVFLILFLLLQNTAWAEVYKFIPETESLTKLVKCKNSRIVAEDEFSGALYGCIAGEAETVKLFVNQPKGKDSVENIKLVWNEWTTDIGYGLSADKNVAQEFIERIAGKYAADHSQAIIKAFFEKESKAFSENAYAIEYRWQQGPKIAEHLLNITPKLN